eukprot:snap_masked-scaffold_2-processed-gene-27.55-mRNA-1 protein AED:1.00 eAED:1.00 QI:0/0/0/0/1/1/3/0/69
MNQILSFISTDIRLMVTSSPYSLTLPLLPYSFILKLICTVRINISISITFVCCCTESPIELIFQYLHKQ